MLHIIYLQIQIYLCTHIVTWVIENYTNLKVNKVNLTFLSVLTKHCKSKQEISKMLGKHSFNLEKQFTFYASYHNNPANVFIHILCIWPILATGLVMLQVSKRSRVQPAKKDSPTIKQILVKCGCFE